MSSRIALVIGAGPNIGMHAVETFHAKGYQVAFASRSASDNSGSDRKLAIKCDLNEPSSVPTIFETVRRTWGEPSVVLYNPYSMHRTKPEKSLDVSLEDFEYDLRINTTSAFVAAREAQSGFEKLEGPRTFLYTGNIAICGPVPGLLTLGVGKNATAHIIEMADQLYREKNIRYHFVDERKEDGRPMYGTWHGQAHADIFLGLAERTTSEELPWNVTFVEGKGYTVFPNQVFL